MQLSSTSQLGNQAVSSMQGDAMHVSAASMSFTSLQESPSLSLSSATGQNWLRAIADKTGVAQPDLQSLLQGGSDLRDILKDSGVTMAAVRRQVRLNATDAPQPGGGADNTGSSQDSLSNALQLAFQSLASYSPQGVQPPSSTDAGAQLDTYV